MKPFRFVVFCLQLIASCSSEVPANLLSTAIKLKKISVAYPNGVISERDLSVCQQRSACNIIHKRFWLPPLIERLCRCPQRNECPWTWSAGADKQAVYLNNRSQLKFCTDMSFLSNCSAKKPALTISTLSSTPEPYKMFSRYSSLRQTGDKPKRQTPMRNITITCKCQDPHYWKLKSNASKLDSDNNTQQTYYCSKLKKCDTYDFCGYVRLDTYSTYYRCSCPRGHMCITRNKAVYPAEEILYNGTCYKAFCLPRATEKSSKLIRRG